MDFPDIDTKTDERFARLWPTVDQNESLKLAAREAAVPLKFSREGDGPHFRLYEARIPEGVDVDAKFAPFATPEAKTAALAESAEFRAAKGTVDKAKAQTAAEKYPENVRYYPAMSEGNRERFLAAVKEAGYSNRSDVVYNSAPEVKAFVSNVGPIPSLAEWQTPEAKALWEAGADRLASRQGKSRDAAADAIDATALRAEGRHFMADNAKGLVMPSVKQETQRAAALASIKGASVEDLTAVHAVTTAEHKALSRKQYAIQIKAAQEKDGSLTKEAFNAMNDRERRVAAGYNEIDKNEFARMIGLQYGAQAIKGELQERGVELSRDQALDKQSKAAGKAAEGAEKAPEQQKAAEPEKAPERKGRAGSRGAAHAAALAGGQGR